MSANLPKGFNAGEVDKAIGLAGEVVEQNRDSVNTRFGILTEEECGAIQLLTDLALCSLKPELAQHIERS